MKKDIHPQYNSNVPVKCSCGNTFETGSTADKIEVEVCSACHPFYTGTAKFIDTAGRVDKFRAKMKTAEDLKAKSKKSK
ncbi:TPA: 50S ribosomal protein L31 [Candidatus Berkelbacteria bacterium]|uniref:Large ribosomal subunit protein bL31 n=1 Tax=Berkelbacteria bacterium GW2011_GWE1_39_12 TaxID=1618337 RepID=A0A0G4B4T4_9BACT|nr:MAG: 50S ribosomal protein L31, large subunit ribosomal protein L31 [Berkelbacteria bacterium GW2011_GWE1_39_12]HBO60600.1 50S ribosomal protein L31 [Candidatus Berkelbacteria bacterium]